MKDKACQQMSFKPHLHVLKTSARHDNIFGNMPRLPALRLPPRGSLGTPKILSSLVPHFMWDRYVYTLKIGSAMP